MCTVFQREAFLWRPYKIKVKCKTLQGASAHNG
jgi:hypothetical protein